MNDEEFKRYTSDNVKLFVDYLTERFKEGELVMENKASINNRKEKLEKMMAIYNSDSPMDVKISEMTKLYENPFAFLKSFNYFIKLSSDKPSLIKKFNPCEEIYSFYQKAYDEGLVRDVLYYNKYKNYFANYDYARFILSEYVKSPDSFDTCKWLDEYGLDSDTLDYCAGVIEELDSSLFDEYSSKVALNSKVRATIAKDKLDNIISGIETGYLLDGSEFNEIEFFKLLPFYNKESAKEISSDFGIVSSVAEVWDRLRVLVRELYPESLGKFYSYTNARRINNRALESFNIDDIYNTFVSVNGRVVTDEEKTEILKYMEENSIPMISKAYTLVRNQFLVNGFSHNLDPKVKRYTPSKKYTLVP